LLRAFEGSDALIVRTVANTPPTLFDISLRNDLKRLSGDRGGRQLFEKYADKVLVLSEIGCGETRDVDTEEAYKKLKEIFRERYEATSN
jgi:CTP:molybdopterin cytidylyltransferase MocA